MADQKQLIVPVFGDLFAANVDGAKGLGQVLPAGGIEIGGRLVIWPPES